MTSKNSFWVSCKENHKRRVWVWIVAVLSQLLLYGGVAMIYLSRIKGFYAEGSYRTLQDFKEAMYQAAKDALGFSDNLYGFVFLLGAVIGMQGFSYLYDKRKVDVYHSVPVSKNRRFAVVYVNGLAIWLFANLSGLLLGAAIAASQGAVNAEVLADMGLAFVWNLFMFLAYYHMMILAVMLTGSRFMTVFVFLVFVLYELCVNSLAESMRFAFFKTASNYYLSSQPKLSVAYDCSRNIWDLKRMSDAASKAGTAMPIVAKWAAIAAVFLGLAYLAYRKRPSEAAGKAVAFPFIEPLLKVAVAVPVALMAGILVYDTSYQNEVLWVAGMLAGGLIFCAAMEVLYDFDIRSLFRHPLSSGIALAGVLAIFCIYKWDLFGYDSYVPAQNKVESIAIAPDGYYDSYYDEELSYVDASVYGKEHMFLTDTAPVLKLAEAAQQADIEKMSEQRPVKVLYRLKSGRQTEREIQVDYDDPETAELLNQIFQTKAFKEGIFQAMSDERYCDRVEGIAYTNGAVRVAVPKEEAKRLQDAWNRDMEQFDFKMARKEYPSGMICLEYGNYTQRELFVYDSFENTIAVLEEHEAYYPAQLEAADIDSVTVTCYHNELKEPTVDMPIYRNSRAEAELALGRSSQELDSYVNYAMQETFYDEEQIAQILPHIYSADVTVPWKSYKGMEDNYSVEIVFKKDSVYPYQRGNYYFVYNFWAGQVPDFVAEATAYTE